MTEGYQPSSFRDPSGFLYYTNGELYRQINAGYVSQYDKLMQSGLYNELTNNGLLVSHSEQDISRALTDAAFKIIKPEHVPFISYPYEWCFSQLKDAALLTLQVAERALKCDMVLKDASAYNVQFLKGRPIFIDTLSFEHYHEGDAWVAYRQFCQHFLAPLALMAYVDNRFNQWSKISIDGIPLDFASRLLPLKTRFKLSLLIHLHLHGKSQQRYADKPMDQEKIKRRNISRQGFLGIIKNLESAIRSLHWKLPRTEWGEYYGATNYNSFAMQHKRTLVGEFLSQVKPKTVWDLGANTGAFSRIASDRGIHTVAFDIDPVAVEKNYRVSRERNETALLPMLLDLTNPSSGIGWQGNERTSLLERGPVEVAFALALVHHLAISNNVPLAKIAKFLADSAEWLIIEFVPKSDSQVKRLLATREDIFPHYTKDGFETAFRTRFQIEKAVAIQSSDRILYLMKKL